MYENRIEMCVHSSVGNCPTEAFPSLFSSWGDVKLACSTGVSREEKKYGAVNRGACVHLYGAVNRGACVHVQMHRTGQLVLALLLIVATPLCALFRLVCSHAAKGEAGFGFILCTELQNNLSS
jgi:hypothetical protein